jgi:hypothetical protein
MMPAPGGHLPTQPGVSSAAGAAAGAPREGGSTARQRGSAPRRHKGSASPSQRRLAELRAKPRQDLTEEERREKQ